MLKAAPAVLKKPVPRKAGCLTLLFVVAVMWVVFDIQARKTVLADPLAVYRDPDHRLRPLDQGIGTNSDGLRCRLEAGDISESDFTVLFLGDSFVFGPGLEVEGALPQRFERGLRRAFENENIHVVNGAWPSASPLLALRLLRDVGAKYRPDLVLYGFDMTDFRDDLMYRNLIDKQGVYRLIDIMPASLWLAAQGAKSYAPDGLYRAIFQMPRDRFFAVNRPMGETLTDMMPVWRTLEEISRFSRRQLDAEFDVVVLPRNFQYSYVESPNSWERGDYQNLGPWVKEPFHFFEERAAEATFGVYSLLPAFEETAVFPTCYVGDPHWTPAGAQVAADALLEMAVAGNWLGRSREASDG